jgi:NTE family protein
VDEPVPEPADQWHWPRNSNTRRLNIALQGGGSHGAFTWGVLDRLLEDGRLAIEGISGTSAGAVNAAVMTEGLVKGGPEVAREKLERFWRTVSEDALGSPIQRSAVDILLRNLGPRYQPRARRHGNVVAGRVAVSVQSAQYQSIA